MAIEFTREINVAGLFACVYHMFLRFKSFLTSVRKCQVKRFIRFTVAGCSKRD